MDHKTTPKWAWPGSRGPIRNRRPLTTVKTANVNYMYINNNKTAKYKAKLKKVYNDV